MGIRIFSRSDSSHDTPTSVTAPNPNKFRWSLVSTHVYPNGWCVAILKYHDCTSYEGVKVLVYDSDKNFEKLRRSGAIDPHFNAKAYSPVARFAPTVEGVEQAKRFAERAGQ